MLHAYCILHVHTLLLLPAAMRMAAATTYHNYTRINSIAGALAVMMLMSVVGDVDCIIAYPLVVLLWNGAHATIIHLTYTYRRSMHTVDHLYLGEGLHDALRILLAMIESVSILFRAVSLSLRVVCNSIAGHLLLSVLVEMTTSTVLTVGALSRELVILWLSSLLLMKGVTCIIQGVVYSRLLVVYYTEVLH
nr:ATP synthase F0 subunit a [Rhynchopus humris]